MKTLKQQTRLAGILYILLILLGPFIIIYIPSMIIVEGNASQTVENLLANETLFRIGIFGEVLIFSIEILMVTTLYIIFRRVNRYYSLIGAISRFGMVAIMGVNVIIYLAILSIIRNPEFLIGFSGEQLDTLVLLLFNIHENTVFVWGVFFAIHLAILGYLIFISEFAPKVIGYLIMIGSLGHIFDSLRVFFNMENSILLTVFSILLLVSFIGELSFTIWLLINKKTDELN
ncbi:DUF4386 domain-containing protein [Mycoplasmatota bacterium zrk1]